jgi:hypothetical protein
MYFLKNRISKTCLRLSPDGNYSTEPDNEKRHERSQDKAKFDEKAEFMPINEHFEENFNAVLTSAIVSHHSV